jgi:hypothetical protein
MFTAAPSLLYTDAEAIRANINRANSLYSTGPRTEAGKRRSSQNALTHGLTSLSAVLPSEDPAAYQEHVRQFQDEYRPATPTESQLVRELADTAWRQNRIPRLEAALLQRAERSAPAEENPSTSFDIVDAHRAIATLGMHSQRLSRQFQKTLAALRELQDSRHSRDAHLLARASALLQLHKEKGIPYDPAQDGFVFTVDDLDTYLALGARIRDSQRFDHHPDSARPRASAAVASRF